MRDTAETTDKARAELDGISAPSSAVPPLRVAIAGLGTVGTGVLSLLEANRDLIARRAGRPIEAVVVSARDRNKDRGIDLSPYRWDDDMDDLADHADVDAIVELIGGADGPALTLARNALKRGKAFITANKAMIAQHGMDLAALADIAGTPLKFEAAVAGGIPVIKGLREGTAANHISRVYGILNGTCNYILSTMETEGKAFPDVLKAAQDMGYAEADPSTDVDGIDAAHKLSILATIAFGSSLNFPDVNISGIRTILPQDIEEADDLGYRIRLIGMAAYGPDGLMQRVAPMLVPTRHPLAHVMGATNAVVAEGNFVGRLLFQGSGAGAGPTASAVVADLIDVARDEYGPAFAMPVSALSTAIPANPNALTERYYVRFAVRDQLGVLAEVTAAMRDAGVSIQSVSQSGHTPDGDVFLAIVTHECSSGAIADMHRRLQSSASIAAPPLVLPVLKDE
jgi:homoserine dehydrogenase